MLYQHYKEVRFHGRKYIPIWHFNCIEKLIPFQQMTQQVDFSRNPTFYKLLSVAVKLKRDKRCMIHHLRHWTGVMSCLEITGQRVQKCCTLNHWMINFIHPTVTLDFDSDEENVIKSIFIMKNKFQIYQKSWIPINSISIYYKFNFEIHYLLLNGLVYISHN